MFFFSRFRSLRMERRIQELRKPAPPPVPNQLARTKVLVVEDNRLLADAWGRLLARLGAAVTIQGDVPTAMGALRQHAKDLDVVLLDYVLPGGEASEVVATAASLGCPCGILLVTGHGGDVARSAAARLRVDDVLLKPVDAAELVAAISWAREQGLRRRVPVAPIDPTVDDLADLSERVLQAIFGVLRRSGIGKGYRQRALEARVRGHTDEHGAETNDVSVDRLRGQVGEALADLGAESGFEVVRVIADRVASELSIYAGAHGSDPHVWMGHLEVAIAEVIAPAVPTAAISDRPRGRRAGYRVHPPAGREEGRSP